MFAKLKGVALAAVAAGAMMAAPAQADYLFSGAGASGNLFPGVEPWSFNFNTSGGINNWGSPGVGAGTTTYSHDAPAFGFDITFEGGGTILPGSIEIGNSAGCQGSTSGGTTFCTIGPQNIWIATQVGPSSIAFRAQDDSFDLVEGQPYFVNIMFEGETPTSFTGRWVTTFSPDPVTVPEPGSLALFGTALAFVLARRRRPA